MSEAKRAGGDAAGGARGAGRRLARSTRCRRSVLAIALAAVTAAGAAGCSKEESESERKAKAPAASSRDGVIEAWKKGGLLPSPFTAATVAFGKDCQSGTVNGVDVLLCEFPSEDEAKAAEEKGLAWVGDTTGISRAAGKVLVAAADRRKADPSGRTINQLTKLLQPK